MPKPFAINLEKTKRFFFDTKAVESLVDKAKRQALSKVGAFIRTTAIRSTKRKRKPKPSSRRSKRKRAPMVSAPGSPPFTHTAGKNNLKFVLFAYEPASESVIVGPVRLSTKRNVANLMEFGGTATVQQKNKATGIVWSRRRARYRPRPYMQPALAENAPKLPNMMKEMLERESRRRRR
jgi:hypothetical protein